MPGDGNAERELKHQLANAEQQKRALQQLLHRASDQIEELVEGECADEDKQGALKAAEKFRRAASL
jgi:HPt (histidine-containing phosphotransfer) domain-containing protein